MKPHKTSAGLHIREASEANRKILEGIRDPLLRQQYLEQLRRTEWVIFTPQEIDFERFADLLNQDPELRKWVESEVDPVLIAELLSRRYPALFYTIEHAYRVGIDWKVTQTRKGGHSGKGGEDPPAIPGHLLTALSESELAMVARRELRKWIKALNRDPHGTLAEVARSVASESDAKRRSLLEYLHGFMTELTEMKFPGFVSELVAGIPFPSMHARIWITQILERKNALIVGDVGTQKTSAAVIGLEKLGARATIVICRSYARYEVWVRELRRYYCDPSDPFVVRSSSDIPALERMMPTDLRRHRFCIVGYGSLQTGIEDDGNGGATYGARLTKALARLEPDAIVIDEAHAIKHKANRTRRVLELARVPSVQYRLMLTATPFENSPNEVAHLATLLDPDHFPTEDVFLAMCRDNPRVFFGLMSSRMCDYFAQDEVLDLPPTNVTPLNLFPTVTLECPQDIRDVHDAVREDGTLEVRRQILRMTRLLVIPYVGRDWYPEFKDAPCFRDPLANPKLAYLRREVGERIKRGKVVVASGIYASGITRELADAEDGPLTYEVATLLEQWFPEKVLRIDPSVAQANRGYQKVIQAWRGDPEKRILVASVQAASESLNLSISAALGVDHITIFFLGLPWKPTQYWQFIGRFLRPGAAVPLEVLSLLLKDTADDALLSMNLQKWRNFLIGVHGMPLLTEEEEALERATFEKVMLTPARWLREAFSRMRGLGEHGIARFLGGHLKGLPVRETIARYYLTVEDHGPSGHIARFMVPVLRQWHGRRALPDWKEVLDAGCGPLVLERRLGEPVFGVDMNPMMLQVGKEHSYHGGKNAVEGRLSQLPVHWGEQFTLVVLSLALHLTSRRDKVGGEVERVRILREINRVLKPDGFLWITVPEFCFDLERLNGFVEGLEAFGFEAVEPLTGRVAATDHPEHPFAFWSVLVRKRDGGGVGRLACPLFVYETSRAGKPRIKGKPHPDTVPVQPVMLRHEQFVVQSREGKVFQPEQLAERVKFPAPDVEAIHRAMVEHFRIREHPVKEKLREILLRVRPKSWSELKEVWREVKHTDGAPRLDWADLQRFARRYFGELVEAPK